MEWTDLLMYALFFVLLIFVVRITPRAHNKPCGCCAPVQCMIEAQRLRDGRHDAPRPSEESGSEDAEKPDTSLQK